MTFNQYKDAKTMFAAIETRFCKNEATKKTQKTLLKQLYENFIAAGTKSLDLIFNRLQKLVSQLAVLGVFFSQEDLNLIFLRSLPSKWNTHVVRGTTSTNTSSQNMAFMSSPSPNSTNEVPTVFEVSTASPQVSTANLSDATVYAFLANQPNRSQLVHEDLEQIHEDDLEEIDLKWQVELLSMRAKRPVNPKRNFQRRATYNNRNFFKKVNTAKEKVNTAKPNSAVLNAVRANKGKAVKASACWVWRPIKLDSASIILKKHTYIDARGRSKSEIYAISLNSRSLMEGMLHLGEELNVVRLLMCDKKNSVLFTDTKCFVLSPDFELADEVMSYLKVMNEFYEEKGIKREYSVARTPQHYGVAERRNRTLIEAARTMLADSKLLITFWAKAINTACYVQNRVLVVKPHFKTPYELFRDEGFFVGYSTNSKAFRVYNTKTRKAEENLHIKFLKNKPLIAGDRPKWLFDIDTLTESINYVPVIA
nr:hypothetical protein [Tanacetum cinerariifolium]